MGCVGGGFQVVLSNRVMAGQQGVLGRGLGLGGIVRSEHCLKYDAGTR